MKRTALAVVLFWVCSASLAQDRVDLVPPTSTGVVVADRSVILAAKIVGRVDAVNVEEGDSVNVGDILIDIADAELRANLSAARARLKIEELNLAHQTKLATRVRSLRKQASVSQEVLDEANFKAATGEQRVASAASEVARASAVLDETKIKAPFSGIVISKHIEKGHVTAPGEPLMTLEDHSRLKFRTSVKEQDVVRITRGQTITVTIDALGGMKLDAIVTKIIPSGNPSTHDFVVEATLPTSRNLFPGMFGKAEFSP